MGKEKIMGIDLGTTNSVVAVVEGTQPTVIHNPEGARLTPSAVAFTDKGDRLVGVKAKRQAVTNPTRTIFSIKRFMGRRHSEVAEEEKMVSYDIEGGQQELVKVKVNGKEFTPPEISAMILQELKHSAEEYLGEEVKKAVITVPAYFNDSQRQATKDAGTIAGLEVVRIINEPTAASLAYGLDKKADERVAVFDFGGGTYDISILEVGDGVFEVKATKGDTHLGGDNIDQILIDYIADEFKKEHGIDLRNDPMALQRLKEGAEKAKCDLSGSTQTDVNLPFVTARMDNGQSTPLHLTMTLTRAKFEQLAAPVFDRLRRPLEQCMQDAKLKPGEIDEVIMVGGSTRIPKVIEIVTEIFGKEPHKGVNPDEVVAVGAAIQGAVLAGDISDVVLVDVTPLSLGIETLGGVMTRLIERNTAIPTSRKEVFTTAADNQTNVEIHVLQGEREMAGDNRTLARFQLAGIPPAPRGLPQIEVSFDIDANGILNVKAGDLGTGKEQTITVKSSSGLSKEEIEQMRKEAEEHADEDKQKRALADARNKADSMAYTVENTLKEHGDKISAEEKGRVESALEDLKKTKESATTAEEIEAAVTRLEEASHKLAEVIYSQSKQQQEAEAAAQGQEPTEGEQQTGETADTGGDKGDDDVVDADFEVKE